MRAFLVAALSTSLAAVLLGAQTGPRGDQTPVAHEVRIDVIAVDAAGRVVTNLSASDFELREGAAPQTIDEVRFVSTAAAPPDEPLAPVDSAADERREAGRAGARLFAIYLDEYHISPGASADRTRDALTALLDRSLGPRDLIVVMKPLDSLFTIRLTRDRDRARQIVASLEGRKGDYTPRNTYERNYMAGAPERIEVARTQVTVSALNALALHLGSLGDLRSSILVVSEGLRRTPRQRGREYLATIDSTVAAANRSKVSIYPIDPRPPMADPPATEGERAELRTLAVETDGRFVEDSGDLGAAVGLIANDSAAYYVLTYRAAHVENGGFHEVQVRVKRAGVEVRARKGYYAPSVDDKLRAALLARANNPPPPQPIEPARHQSPLIRPWFGFSLGEGGKTRVTFVWEAVGAVPGGRSRRAPPGRLVLTALAPDKTVLFDGPVLPAGPGGIDDVGTPSRAVFDLAPGRLELRMKIEDTGGGPLDSDVRDVTVRDLRRGIAIGTPEVFRARTAREFAALDANAAAVPVSSRVFSRTERLLIRVPAYSPADGGRDRPAVSARLLNRINQPMRALDVQPAAGNLNRIDLPLAGLANGDYFIEIAAKGRAGEAKELITFRVTN
ncbi:MAG: VWA domain-containing protein [Vicinamibacterales bacterium]